MNYALYSIQCSVMWLLIHLSHTQTHTVLNHPRLTFFWGSWIISSISSEGFELPCWMAQHSLGPEDGGTRPTSCSASESCWGPWGLNSVEMSSSRIKLSLLKAKLYQDTQGEAATTTHTAAALLCFQASSLPTLPTHYPGIFPHLAPCQVTSRAFIYLHVLL